jgi:DNA-binding transcriptional MerR regulator
MATLPPKLYFRIGEVASLVGVEPHVLRYWEREFRSIRPTKSAKGQRVYSRRDVENLMRVRDLLYADGFTIAGAKKKLQRSGAEPELATGASTAPDTRGVAETYAVVASVAGASSLTPVGAALAHDLAPQAAPATGVAPRNGAAETRGLPPRERAALKELRSEIEAFLAELSD